MRETSTMDCRQLLYNNRFAPVQRNLLSRQEHLRIYREFKLPLIECLRGQGHLRCRDSQL